MSERGVTKVTSYGATDGQTFKTREGAESYQLKIELEDFCNQHGIFSSGLSAREIADKLHNWQDQLVSILAGEPQ